MRDGVLEAINEDMIRETMKQYEDGEKCVKKVELDPEESRKYIEEHLTDIEETAEAIIHENGYSYDAEAELGIRWIPEKNYGNMTFPAGNYEALNITIGEGAGQNWWCVLFPPLCLIDGSAGEESGSGTLPEVTTAVALELKFKTLEIINR